MQLRRTATRRSLEQRYTTLRRQSRRNSPVLYPHRIVPGIHCKWCDEARWYSATVPRYTVHKSSNIARSVQCAMTHRPRGCSARMGRAAQAPFSLIPHPSPLRRRPGARLRGAGQPSLSTHPHACLRGWRGRSRKSRLINLTWNCGTPTLSYYFMNGEKVMGRHSLWASARALFEAILGGLGPGVRRA